jgi:hypothetical protein
LLSPEDLRQARQRYGTYGKPYRPPTP